MENEVWKSIPGFEGLYQVSSLGRVISCEREIYHCGIYKKHKQRVLSPIAKPRYLYVCLRKEGKTHRQYIHRLVAISFIPKSHQLNEVNHIDGNPKNNNLENLEWCNRSQNLKHAYAIGLTKGNAGKEITKKMKAVVSMSIDGRIIGSYRSIKDASKTTGVHKSSICNSCKNGKSIAGGLKWKYS